MPSKSKSQQAVMGMALAVRRGEMKKSEVVGAAKEIANSDMTDKEIRDFAKTKRKGLPEKVSEDIRSLQSLLETT